MINNADLTSILRTAKDISVVVEIYPPDAVPEAEFGFNPSTALKRYSRVAGITFAGQEYTRHLKSIGSIERSSTDSSNSFSISITNFDREGSNFEFETGFDGCIVLCRAFSRSLSTNLSKSIILFVGRCEQGKNGTSESISVSAKDIINAAGVNIPRRQFNASADTEGRQPNDPLYEGFSFMPQTGVATYSHRERRNSAWGLLAGIVGFFVFKKNVSIEKTVAWSSFSDMDASKSLAEVLGRWQMIGVNLAYRDVGTNIQLNSAFCEGEISHYSNIRSINSNLPLDPTAIGQLTGKIGGIGDQTPDETWVQPGHYSRTAYLRLKAFGSEVDEVDAAPDVAAIVYGRLVLTPNDEGVWEVSQWSDNAAAHTRWLLTSPDYFNLDESWIDDDAATECFNYNNEIIFNTSLSDFVFVPDTESFANLIEGGESGNNYLMPTSSITPEYFKFIKGDASVSEAFDRPARSFAYDNSESIIPIDPDDYPPVDGGGETATLKYFLQRRYSCNLGITEQVKGTDALNDSLFPTSRLFTSQGANGKIKINNKKPISWALATEEFLIGATSVSFDDVSPWIENLSGFALIDPHTTESEVREVVEANYSEDQSDVTLTASENFTVTGFAGCDGAHVPAQATITVGAAAEGEESSFILDGIEITFIAGTDDTLYTVAAFIYATINAHPVLQRRFKAFWQAGDEEVTIKAKFGSLELNSALEKTHAAPFTDPTDAPVLSIVAGTMAGGLFKVAYAFENERGQTLLSPFEYIVVGEDEGIEVDSVAPPAGASVVWYVSPATLSEKLRFYLRNDGETFTINELPSFNNSLPPDLNRTGAEVMRVAAVFSDRGETRTNILRSNVLQGTFEFLGEKRKVVNEVRGKYRDSTQDFRLVELKLRNKAHIEKTKKVSSMEVNLQGVDNSNQAYRILSGILAEYRDADFPYKWAATREALLLEENDVVCITDAASGVVNLPVQIETLEINANTELPKISFTAWKYTTTLHDDSVAERIIPVLVEN